MEKIQKSDKEWQKLLTPKEFYVCRQKGTERPFSGKYNDYKGSGVFVCKCCGNPLFDATTKFDSGTGWPSFYEPIHPQAVEEHRDLSHGMIRTEATCAKCGAHLGHVFPDGPKPTGLRYCINSVSLDLKEKDEVAN